MHNCWRIIKIVFISLIFFSSFITIGQAIYFNKTVDLGGIFGSGHSIHENDSTYVISGVIGGGKINIGFISIDLFGNLNFMKSYGEVGASYFDGRPGSMKSTSNHYIIGGSKSLSDSSSGLFLKYNLGGDTIFTRSYYSQASAYLILNSSYGINNSGYIFTGEEHISGYNSDVVLLKTDSLGNEIWRKLYGWNTADNGFSIIQTPDSGFVVGGYTYQPGLDDSGDPLIVKFDKNGNYEWSRKPGGMLDDDKAMVCLSSDSAIIALTVLDDSTYGAGECGRVSVIKYDLQGAIIWNKKYGTSWHGRQVGNIKLLLDSGYICCGSVIDSSHTQYFGWILKINSEGDSIWYREHSFYDGNHGVNHLYDIIQTSDNGYLSCGETKAAPPNNLQKIWVLKVDSIGCDTAGCDPTVGIEDRKTVGRYDNKAMGIELWPNPCSTVLSISLTSRQSVGQLDSWQLDKLRMEVYDIFGRKVPIPNPFPNRGKGEVVIDISSLPPGLYLLVVKDGRTVKATAKFVVAR